MSLTPNFTLQSVRARFERIAAAAEENYIKALQYVGEEAVNFARSLDTYKDSTGNLRSSIGYIVLKDGQVLNENFQLSRQGTDRVTGLNTGKKRVDIIKADYPRGYVLIIVAGMNYAAAVESKGKDVITGATLFAADELKEQLEDIKLQMRTAL